MTDDEKWSVFLKVSKKLDANYLKMGVLEEEKQRWETLAKKKQIGEKAAGRVHSSALPISTRDKAAEFMEYLFDDRNLTDIVSLLLAVFV
jgi:hypothetical protein